MLRKRYIIKPRLQIKYLIMALIVVCLTGAAVYYAFWSSLIRSAGMEQLSSGEIMALEHAYQTSFIWVVIILVSAIGLESIFLFHRIIGPIFVFERAVRKLANGDLTAFVHSRKHDELKEMAAQMQKLIANLRTTVTDDRRRIEEIRAAIDTGDAVTAKAKLAELTQWFKLDTAPEQTPPGA